MHPFTKVPLGAGFHRRSRTVFVLASCTMAGGAKNLKLAGIRELKCLPCQGSVELAGKISVLIFHRGHRGNAENQEKRRKGKLREATIDHANPSCRARHWSHCRRYRAGNAPNHRVSVVGASHDHGSFIHVASESAARTSPELAATSCLDPTQCNVLLGTRLWMRDRILIQV